jgi:hypothetical protein
VGILPNRIIKESICTSENIDNLTPEEEIFFYRMLVCCDDYGRTDARPQILRAKCFPLRVDRIKEKDIEKWLHSLIKQQLITIYIVEDKQYIQVITWTRHQQVRARYSKYPDPSEGDVISSDINCNQEIANVPENRIRESNTNTNTKTRYADNVHMSEKEYQTLIEKHGEGKVFRAIEILDNYKGANGKQYKSDYRAILNWVIERVNKEFEQRNIRAPNKRQVIK